MRITYENGEVVVRIPCTAEDAKAAPPSKTGKSRMIATTNGFAVMPGAPDGIGLSLNLIGGGIPAHRTARRCDRASVPAAR